MLAWALLWYGNFSIIEYGVSMLGLITISFVVAAPFGLRAFRNMSKELKNDKSASRRRT